MSDQERCPDCPPHRYHSRRCFAVDGMKQCPCPGSPSLVEQGRRLEAEAKELGDESRRLLTSEGVKEFFG